MSLNIADEGKQLQTIKVPKEQIQFRVGNSNFLHYNIIIDTLNSNYLKIYYKVKIISQIFRTDKVQK